MRPVDPPAPSAAPSEPNAPRDFGFLTDDTDLDTLPDGFSGIAARAAAASSVADGAAAAGAAAIGGSHDDATLRPATGTGASVAAAGASASASAASSAPIARRASVQAFPAATRPPADERATSHGPGPAQDGDAASAAPASPAHPAAQATTPHRPAMLGKMTLLWQIAMVLGVAVLISSGLAGAIGLGWLDLSSRQAGEAEAESIARGTAIAVEEALDRGDDGAAGRALARLAHHPAVARIAVYGNDGHLVAEAGRDDATGPVERTDATRKTEGWRQMPGMAQVRTDLSGTEPRAIAWEPVLSDRTLGWVMVRTDLSVHLAQRRASRAQLLVGIAVTAVLVFGGVLLFLRRQLMPLGEIARFASRFNQRLGQQLEVSATTREVWRLGDALNEASTTLARQYETLARHDDETEAVMNTTTDAVLGIGEDGRITLVNAAVTSMFGIKIDLAAPPTLDAMLPELDRRGLARRLGEAVITGGRKLRIARFESTALRNGGIEFPVEISLTGIEGGTTTRYACFVRDITEKRAAEESLRLFRRAVDASNHGVVISSMTTPGEPILYVNEAFEKITGFGLVDAIGRKCAFLQRHLREQPGIDEIRRAVAEQRETTVTLRNFKKDGTPFWNELSIAPVFGQDGRLSHYVGVQTDVTARIEAIEARARHSTQLNTVFTLSPDGFVLFDGERRVAYVNPAFSRMTGLSAESLVGRVNMAEYELMMTELCGSTAPYPTLPTDDSAEPEHFELLRPTRRILAREVRYGAPGSAQLILHYRDVTRESEVDRMKSEFLSTAAHELRTPMVSIFGFTELLLHRKFTPERTHGMLETIHRQTGLLVNLVNELLDLARIEARGGKDFRIGPVSMRELVQETVDGLMIPGDQRKVEIEMPEHDDPIVDCDPEKTRQAITNVLGNAFKYSPNGGRVRLELASDDDGVAVRVSDEGLGMTPEQLGRVFERFYRADPSGNIPGTGLGLCLVKEIVELQGGQVTLDSEHGRGTTATIRFPRKQPAQLAA